MNILNNKSNLTPQPRIHHALGCANRQGERKEKRSYAESGLKEHACNMHMPYTCVTTVF